MHNLPEVIEARNRLNRFIEQETPLAPIRQSPADDWKLAYVRRAGGLLTIWVFEPHNMDRHKAMLEHDCAYGKARESIDLSDAEWGALVLAQEEAR
jgi:hypothetical protein